MTITCIRFEGWALICPYCKYEQYVSDEDIAFDPRDTQIHEIKCEKCGEKFEIIDY